MPIKPTPALSPEDQVRWDTLMAKVKMYRAHGCMVNFTEDLIDSVHKYHNVDVIAEFEALADMMWKEHTRVPF